MKSNNFKISGMTCSSCANVIKTTTKKIDGVKKVKVSLALNYMSIQTDDDVSDKDVIDKIASVGYKLEHIDKVEFSNGLSKELKILIIKFSLAFFLTIWLWVYMILMLAKDSSSFTIFLSNPIFQIINSSIVIFIIGFQYFKDVYYSIKKLKLNMSFLIVLGTSSAFILSLYLSIINNWINSYMIYELYYEAANTIITLVLLGKVLEHVSKDKTSKSLKKLSKLVVEEATIIVNDDYKKIATNDLKIGDIVLIKSGDYIPIDGIIIEGETYVDESMLTGETIPVHKILNSNVIGSTLNKDYTFKMEVTSELKNSTINKIINLVQEAQSSETKIQKIVDKVSSYFVPVVVFISLITYMAWCLYDNSFSQRALINAIVVLIISCPCALGLATPTAIMVGTSKASELGIIFKDGDFLEKLAKINLIAFDKTGTLTIGKPIVENIFFTDKKSDELLNILKSIELKSNHPLADSIVNHLENNLEIKLDDFESVTSFGLKAKWKNKDIKVGKPNWFNLDSKLEETIHNIESQGKTVFLMSIDNEVKLYVVVSDLLKENAKNIISELHKLKIDTIMLTGDNDLSAKYIANEIGIKNVFSSLSIEDKANIISNYKKENKFVSMIGDGINDSVALKTSDVGIALSNSTDVAIESSDVILLKDNLENILTAIIAAKKTLRKIKTNLFWAFIYNIVAIPVAAFGLLRPEFASFAMALSSVSVVTNSLFLKVKNS